jgi:DNA-binding NtrC family response regulator/class 3 adenylate cyclase/tetratricopeptide (TPR) repeat protein
VGPTALSELLGTSPNIASVRDQLQRVIGHQGPGRLPPILIQGETGTGKSFIARLLHQTRPPPAGPFVEVSCATTPVTLLEEELFGYERGAPDDASSDKPGAFEAGHGGTIVLDEVAGLPEAVQAKLLHVIEHRTVGWLGGAQLVPADAWIISTTNADLQRALVERRFRKDLYHRLAVLTVRLPPLRERMEDVSVLAEALLSRACAQHGLEPKHLQADALRRLLGHDWPGNVRELANAMERAALLVEGATVNASALELDTADMDLPRGAGTSDPLFGAEHAPSLDEAMAEHMRATLERTDWDISRSAALLGISRKSLRARIERFGLAPGGGAIPRRAPPASSASSSSQKGRIAKREHGPSRVSALRDAAPVAYTPRHLVERILTTRSTLEGEQKRLTVLFGDLADSTPLARRLGPEAMHTLLDQLFRMVLEEVHRYEGTVNQFLGDGFMALFGAPLAIEHHERQALLAATAIQRRLSAELPGICAPDGTPSFRIGVNTGTVVVGRIGDNLRMDYTAVGETTNVAARLQSMADRGAVLLSAATYDRARGFADVDPLGHVALKGVADVIAYRLTGLRPSRSTLMAVPDRPLSSFVGRDRELAALQEALRHAEAGRGQAVGILSEPGMGKSRLLLEFRQALTGSRLTYLEGHCLPYGASIPYHPLLEILRTNCRISDADAPEVVARKIAEAVVEVGMNVDEASPYLLNLVGLKEGSEHLESLGPEAVKARTFDALRELCLRGSVLRPIVFVVEDLHWVDRTSEEFLTTMVDTLTGTRALLVATYRHGYTPAWIGRSYATQLALRPLGESDSLGVVRSIVPSESLVPSVADAIVTRGEGNPLFLEELARSMRDRDDGHQQLEIPETLQGLLAARIDRLSDDAKRLLQIASVLGREFPARLLGALWESSASLGARLHDLTRLEFLYQRTWGDDPVYAFTHVLMRDAAYGSLLESRRREYHAAVGQALEAFHGERLGEVVELLAHHFDLSGDDEKAVDYALRAADKARRRWANAEAVRYFENARRHLERLSDSPVNSLRRIDAVLEQSEVRFALGQHTEQIHALETIRALVEGSADPARLASWHYWFGFLHSLTGSPPSLAIHHCHEALRVAKAAGSTDIEAYVESCLAQVSLFTGDLRAGLEVGERAVGAFEARGALWWAGRTLGHLSPIANGLGDWAQSLGYGHRALAHARAVDDRRLTIMATLRIASTLIQRGDPSGGLRCCIEAEGLDPGPFDSATVRAIRGYGLVRAGDVLAGTVLLKEVSAWLERSRLRYTQCQIALWLAEAYLRLGTPEPARAVITPALESSTALGYRYLEGVAHRLLGEALIPDPAADPHLEAALARLQTVDAQNELAKTWLAQATQAQHRGKAADARSLFLRAAAVFERLGTRDEAARVRSYLSGL